MLDYLASQFDLVRSLCPEVQELSIEGNPIVENILQAEFEAEAGYLEAPVLTDHYQG